jgi:putative transposase
MIRTLHVGLLADGIAVPFARLCTWFGVPLRTVYHKPTKAAPQVDPRFAEPIKVMIEKDPFFSAIESWPGFWASTTTPFRGPSKSRPGRSENARSACGPGSKRCHLWPPHRSNAGRRSYGRNGWTTLALVLDCHTRELLGWHLSRSGKATTAASALEHALINRFGTLGKVTCEPN